MKVFSVETAEIIQRPYGVMRMLAGGKLLRTGNLDLRILEIRAGESTTTHHHLLSESIFLVVSGALIMTVDGDDVTLGPDEGVVVLPGEVHVLHNVGDKIAHVLEAMAPPFASNDIIYR